MGQQTDNKSGNITKEQLATILNKYFETTDSTLIPDEVSSENDIELTTIDGKYTINLSEIFKGRFISEIVETFGEKYEDSMIGKTINYTSGTNNVTDWIILGKQVNEQGKNDILITTKNSVSSLPINRTLIEWAGYETKVNNACKSYVGEQGILGTKSATIKEVRSITLNDINNAVGFNETLNSVTISTDNGGFAYPNSSYNDWIKAGDEGYESWTGSNSPEHAIGKNDQRLEKSENMTYITANNTGYWVASRSVDIQNQRADFDVAEIKYGYILAYVLCYSDADGGHEESNSNTELVRPVVVLSSQIPWDDVKDLIGEYATYN